MVIGVIIGLIVGMIIMGMLIKTMMPKMMFSKNQSKLNFEETINAVVEAAKEQGWRIPEVRDLQQDYKDEGLADMTRVKIIYFCNPAGGYKILQHDAYKPLSVMMPMGVSVYETSGGNVYIAAMHLGVMQMMFGGVVQGVLREGWQNFENTIENIVV